jgi:hypothetical protein
MFKVIFKLYIHKFIGLGADDHCKYRHRHAEKSVFIGIGRSAADQFVLMFEHFILTFSYMIKNIIIKYI